MFKIISKPEFTHEVKVMVPVDGGHEEQSFKGRFVALSDVEMESFDLNLSEGQKDFMRAAWVGASDLVSADGEPVEFNDNVKEQMLGWTFCRVALLRTYSSAMAKARVGN
jgi:hypothetical protein